MLGIVTIADSTVNVVLLTVREIFIHLTSAPATGCWIDCSFSKFWIEWPDIILLFLYSLIFHHCRWSRQNNELLDSIKVVLSGVLIYVEILTFEDIIVQCFYSRMDKTIKSLWSENSQLFNPLFGKHLKTQNGLKEGILSGAMNFRKAEKQYSHTFLIKYTIKNLSVAPKASQPS